VLGGRFIHPIPITTNQLINQSIDPWGTGTQQINCCTAIAHKCPFDWATHFGSAAIPAVVEMRNRAAMLAMASQPCSASCAHQLPARSDDAYCSSAQPAGILTHVVVLQLVCHVVVLQLVLQLTQSGWPNQMGTCVQ